MSAVVLPASSACFTSGHVIISNSTSDGFVAAALAPFGAEAAGFDAAGACAATVAAERASIRMVDDRRCMIRLLKEGSQGSQGSFSYLFQHSRCLLILRIELDRFLEVL